MIGAKGIFALIVLIGILGVGVVLSYSHWWLRVRDARVTLDGQQVAGAKVFRSSNGSMFIRLPTGRHPLYVVDPRSSGFVGPPSGGMTSSTTLAMLWDSSSPAANILRWY